MLVREGCCSCGDLWQQEQTNRCVMSFLCYILQPSISVSSVYENVNVNLNVNLHKIPCWDGFLLGSETVGMYKIPLTAVIVCAFLHPLFGWENVQHCRTRLPMLNWDFILGSQHTRTKDSDTDWNLQYHQRNFLKLHWAQWTQTSNLRGREKESWSGTAADKHHKTETHASGCNWKCMFSLHSIIWELQANVCHLQEYRNMCIVAFTEMWIGIFDKEYVNRYHFMSAYTKIKSDERLYLC